MIHPFWYVQENIHPFGFMCRRIFIPVVLCAGEYSSLWIYVQENIHPFGFRYCARLDKWTTMAAMTRKTREAHPVLKCQGVLKKLSCNLNLK